MDAARTVEAIHRQGGIAIAAHPYTNLMKWNNLVGVGDLVHSLPFDAVEIRNSNFSEFRANRKAARNLGTKAQLGSSDGHFLESVGRCFTAFPGSDAEDLRAAILDRSTVAQGSCYGIRTLTRFVARRIRAGQRVIPDRRHFWRESADHALAIEVHENRHLDTAVVTPVGRLDDHALVELKSTLTQLADSGVSLVVDLTRVSLMTAEGVTALVAGFRAAQRRGVGFCLASPSRASLRALEGSLLHDHLPWTSDLGEARRRVGTLAPAPEQAPA
jgi:anti-anti-sigma factor